MMWARHLLNNIDLALGLVLSVVLGSVVGLAMSHPLGHLIFGSALGVLFLLTYIMSYSLGAIWMMGAQQGLLVVSVFIWCVFDWINFYYMDAWQYLGMPSGFWNRLGG